MAKVIVFSIQKGGAGKTTTSGVVAHLLSQTHKVLAVDLDSQGNLTELMTQQDIYDFHGSTILEAMKVKDARGYIHKVTEQLSILTADDLLATFPRWLYDEYRGNRALVLRETLMTVQDDFDFIIIDTPPALGDQTINALSAADHVVAMFETSKFCYSALGRFLETVVHVQERVNPDLKLAGILRAMIDSRRSDNKALLELVEEEYSEMVFKTIINRQAAVGRLSISGFKGNAELSTALSQFKPFVKELLEHV